MMKEFALYRWLIAALCLVLLLPGTADAQSASNFELGGQILDFSHPAEMQAAKMKWMKMQISRPATNSTADAQNVITHARNHGFKVLLSIIGDKSALAANPTQYYADYATFVGAVAALHPDAIEVWNEPNIDQEWPAGQINGTNYTNLLKAAYPAIKAADANVMVISGAPAPTGYFGGICTTNGCDDNIFIQQMKTAGAAAYFDCTGLHYNEGVLPPSASSGDPRGNSTHYTRYYPTMVNLYRSTFPTKPLCFTELGYISPDGLGGLPAGLEWGLNTSAQEQADWLAQAATLSREGGIVRMMIVWNVNTTFMSWNTMAGWAIIRQNDVCLPCATLAAAMSEVPTLYASASTATLTWTRITWAERYRLQIALNSAFSAGLSEYSITGDAQAFTTPALGARTYYWRVQAVGLNGVAGAWSAVQTFTLLLG